jgi:crossover junction endodeoxyribonuclease RusA
MGDAMKQETEPVTKRLILPLPPSVNHMYRNVTLPTGRRIRVVDTQGKQWEKDATILASQWVHKGPWKPPDPGVKVALKLWYWWPSKRRMDTHNRSKLLCDTLEGILYPDDRWVLVQEQNFEVDKGNPRVEIELEVKGEEEE